jgi:Xaa-Pro aminopeptidase
MTTVIDVSARAPRLRDVLADRALDGLLVTDLTNVRWLTGFTGSNGAAIVRPDGLTLVTDGRYGDQAERQLAAARCEATVVVAPVGSPLVASVADRLAGCSRIGFESSSLTHRVWQQYADRLGTERLVPTIDLVEDGRRIKDAAEIELLAVAADIATRALAEVAPTIRPGLTERRIRDALESTMRDLGAAGPSYETIVATGPVNAPLPHHRPTDTVVEEGHTIIIDVGALVDGYHSDMTRTFVVGEPTAVQQEVYDIVLAAQTAGVAAVRPGLATGELDAVCRGIIADAGFGPWFGHGTGHGVGLVIHENPFINAAGGWELREGDVVTVEPGVYRGDLGGVRVEDLVVVTSTGCRNLTSFPKDSPCLPSPPTT